MTETEMTLYESLRSFILASENKEIECREYLQYVKEALVRNTVIRFIYLEKERRGSSGNSDYIISCQGRDETGVKAVKAYIWELKAPQCYIFEKDTENRLRPSKDLIQAENQLFHYYHEQKGSEQFKTEFGVTHSDNVLFGGIIIGCHAKRVNGLYEEEKKNKLFEKAMMIRKRYIYDPLHIKIIDWDHILYLLRPPGQPKKEFVTAGDIPSKPLDLQTIILDSSP